MCPAGRRCEVRFEPVEGGEREDPGVGEDGEVLGCAGVEVCVGETAMYESVCMSLVEIILEMVKREGMDWRKDGGGDIHFISPIQTRNANSTELTPIIRYTPRSFLPKPLLHHWIIERDIIE